MDNKINKAKAALENLQKSISKARNTLNQIHNTSASMPETAATKGWDK